MLPDFEDSLRIKLDLLVPEDVDTECLNQWAHWWSTPTTNWLKVDEIRLTSMSEVDRRYFLFFLNICRLLAELGRLPLFDLPKVVAVQQDAGRPNAYRIELDFFLVHFISKKAYEVPIQAAARLASLMAQNRPTPEIRRKLDVAVDEQVIQPMMQWVPAGKSTIPVLRAAHAAGIPFVHLGQGTYQLGWGSRARKMNRSACELDSALGAKMVQNKMATAHVLRAAGLPAPVNGAVTQIEDALKLARQIGFPVVVKPSDQDRGEGVTVDVNDDNALNAAFEHAQEKSSSQPVIVERQVSGVCHRLFMVGGHLLYAVKRHPMSVMGNGVNTIQDLVDQGLAAQAQQPDWARSELRPIDDLALSTLTQQGWSPENIPPVGVRIALRPIESTRWGGVDEEVTSVVHPDNIEVAVQAAKLFDLHIAGVDIISPDITQPWHVNGAILNEVNSAPLLGGAEISRSHLPAFLAQFMTNRGIIPIESFATEAQALEFQQTLKGQGLRCFYTSAERTLDPSGREVVMTFKDIKQRVRALKLRSDVDAVAVGLSIRP